MSHDTVWAKSDPDLVLVTIDDGLDDHDGPTTERTARWG
jgi:hypothetical protein